MNYYGSWTFFVKEVRRFYSVAVQTIFAPIVSTLLFLLIFGTVIETKILEFGNISYSQFLIPGLVMMAILQNAFSNSSSSIIQSKIYGNLSFVLLSPLTALDLYVAFVAAAVVRGLAVGVGVLLVGWMGYDLQIHYAGWILLFAVLSAAVVGGLGLIAGIVAEKYDHLAAFQNFIIMPLTFLSGVFYSIYSLPSFWQFMSMFNPFFYMVDGFRYGFYGVSDVSVGLSLVITLVFLVLVSAINLVLLHKGVKIRH
ncbi:ABC transporter permease [Thiomicrospira sp. ALE5]|uniref:ABC transporter permease n=1 Tax=Thiomicrospira sp. ALE5 TaxID=748650 RepID=UPI0008F16DE4|nr:ABC transporter permease [Thiomicrospira sp. ALE5]SFR59765.1 ABC-2 type transport system permease protein [Thiomicrospira sp. ALE5]